MFHRDLTACLTRKEESAKALHRAPKPDVLITCDYQPNQRYLRSTKLRAITHNALRYLAEIFAAYA